MQNDSSRTVGGTETIGSVGNMLITTAGKLKMQSVNADVDIYTPTQFNVNAKTISLHSDHKDVSYTNSLHTHAGSTITTEAETSITSKTPLSFSITYANSFTFASLSETINAVSTNIGGASFDWKVYRLSNQALNFGTGAKITIGPFKTMIKGLFLCT